MRYYKDSVTDTSLYRLHDGVVESGFWHAGWRQSKLSPIGIGLLALQGHLIAIDDDEAKMLMTPPCLRGELEKKINQGK